MTTNYWTMPIYTQHDDHITFWTTTSEYASLGTVKAYGTGQIVWYERNSTTGNWTAGDWVYSTRYVHDARFGLGWLTVDQNATEEKISFGENTFLLYPSSVGDSNMFVYDKGRGFQINGSTWAFDEYIAPPVIPFGPLITSAGDAQSTYANITWAYEGTCTVADTGIVSWNLTTNATFLILGYFTGELTCLIQGTPDSTGSYWVNLTCSDNDTSSDSVNFTVTVSWALIIPSPGPINDTDPEPDDTGNTPTDDGGLGFAAIGLVIAGFFASGLTIAVVMNHRSSANGVNVSRKHRKTKE
jgi:hypothetical protein